MQLLFLSIYYPKLVVDKITKIEIGNIFNLQQSKVHFTVVFPKKTKITLISSNVVMR